MGIITDVCNANIELSRRRYGGVASTTIATDSIVTVRDCATPIRYEYTTSSVKASLSMDNIAVNTNVDMQFEHFVQGPPCSPVNPTTQ